MSAIAALCDHATTMQAFFDRALRQPVECARFDIFYDAVRPALRRDPGSGWWCDTAADWCGRRAVDDAVKLRKDVAVADIVEAARAKFRDLDTERKTLLETASKLYPAAIRECLDRGLVDSAVRAVEHLGDVLRGLRDVADDWSDHRGALTVAVERARVFAGATPVAPPAPGDAKPAVHHSEDFTTVVWFGTVYSFGRGMQADSVRVLWAEWEKAPGLGLHGGTILDSLDSSIERDRFRFPLVFRDHPAWGAMIVSAGKGTYKLAGPPEKAERLRKQPRRRINAESTQKRR
jgi:hypothetical protein